MAALVRRDRRAARRILGEGLLVGLAGAAVVAVWFLAHDVAAGAPLRTPALLGAMLLARGREPDAVVAAPLVLGYTIVHLLLFGVLGLAGAGLLALAERRRDVMFIVLVLLVAGGVAFVAAATFLFHWLLAGPGLTVVLGANVAALGAMAWLLAWLHREPLRWFRERGDRMVEGDRLV